MIKEGGKMNVNPSITKAWTTIQASLPIHPIHGEKEYKAAVLLLNKLVDIIGNNTRHPLYSMLESIEVFIEDYEETYERIPDVSPVMVLKFLMREHNLKQKDLVEIGPQSVVSEILNGKRKLNLRQIQALASRFKLDSSVFL